jgi:CheY-like chemotaxis protein
MNIHARLVELLLVEDGETDAIMVREAFSDAMIANRLHLATTGEEALDFLHKKNIYAKAPTPDLMLLDLNLPGISGQDVLKNVKSDAALMLIPVVVLTTSRAEDDILKAYRQHANCYIIKPVGYEALKDVVRSVEDFWLGLVMLPPMKS